MITRERLEELIKQGAKIYITNGYEIDLDNEVAVVYDDKLYYQDGIWWYIKDLFETKEQAEWHGKTYTERTERFEPPMWEDIENEYKFFFIHNEDYYCFYVNKNHNEIDLVRNEFYYELGDGDDEATKENYIKACEIVRDLFNKGGAK